MNESSIHQLAAEIGEALKRLEQFRGRVEGLAAAVAAMQEEASGLDTQVRLIAEAERLAGLASVEPVSTAPLQPAQEPGAFPAWLAATWPLIVQRVNQAAAMAEEPTWQESRLVAVHPMLERLAALFHQLSAAAEPDLAPLAEQFGTVIGQFETVAVGMAATAVPTLTEAIWTGTFPLPPFDLAESVVMAERDGCTVPQLNMADWIAEAEAAANEQIALWLQSRAERRVAVRAGEAQAAAEWDRLMAALADLKSQADAVLLARQESGAATPEALPEILALLAEGLAPLSGESGEGPNLPVRWRS